MRSRFFYPPPWLTVSDDATTLTLPDELFHHAVTVLRMRAGDVCELFDGMGNCASVELVQVEKKSAQARWLAEPRLQTENESPLNITLAQCLSSAEKMDWTIEKAVELGVNRIVPLFSIRSQIKLSAERIEKKMAHWQRIIIAACAQSGRNTCPILSTPVSLNDWLTQSRSNDQLKLILHPDPQLPQTLSQVFQELRQPTEKAAIELLIGPESGFDVKEIEAAQACGYHAVLLGPRVLRTETAGLATLSAIQALWGDF